MKASLQDIEKAVRSNFLVVNDGKFLETGGDRQELRLRSSGRMVFTGIAMAYGHRIEDVLTFLDMDIREFNTLLARYHAFNDSGYEKYAKRKAEGKKHYDTASAYDIDLRIYRKTILIKNHILTIKRQRVNLL